MPVKTEWMDLPQGSHRKNDLQQSQVSAGKPEACAHKARINSTKMKSSLSHGPEGIHCWSGATEANFHVDRSEPTEGVWEKSWQLVCKKSC